MFHQSVEELEAEKKEAQKRFAKLQELQDSVEKAQKWLCPVETEGKKLCFGFQVTDVKKPLISVKRIVEKGNYVCFGPEPKDNFIQSGRNGDKLMLQPHGRGSYVMEVYFEDGQPTTITVDSRAEESVCPYGWASQFGIQPSQRKMNFLNASGGEIKHYGQRDVTVVSPF